jgi:nucleolar protein 56
MKITVAKNFLGVFAFSEDGKLLDHILFPKDPAAIADRLSGECEEERVLEGRLARAYKKREVVKNNDQETLKRTYRTLARDLRWAASPAELNEIIAAVNVLLTKKTLRVEKRDRILMQAVTTLEELEKDANVFSEKLREWYGLYFPELTRAVPSNERLARLVSSAGTREGIEDKALAGLAAATAGMHFSERDMHAVQSFSRSLRDLFEAKKTISEYIEQEAKDVFPNLTAIAGPLLACRLVSLAGGLEKMARMPSSTIQLLGGEKALFRHLKGEGKAPKYGVLFGHPAVQQAPQELKGKVARHVAAKLSLAAKVDFFSKDDRGEQLKKELEKDIAGITGKT